LFRLELQTHHQAKAQRKSITHQTGQSGKGLKSCFAWNWQSHHQAKAQRKSIALAKLKAKRQKFKKLFRLELQRHTPSKPTKEIYCTPNKAKRQSIKKRSRCFVFDVD